MAGENRKFQGWFRRGRVYGEDIGLLKPETYMNLSGEAVREAVRYLPLEGEDIILVFDDIDLSRGYVRIRPRGGSGGHLGVESVIDHVGTGSFPRVRIGVGRPAGQRQAADHVLAPVRGDEKQRLSETVDRAVEALDTILEDGIDEAMNRFNGLPPLGQEEEEGRA